MKKIKLITPFLTLLAGAVASIMMYYFRYSAEEMLPRLLLVLVIFFAAGSFIEKKITAFVEKIMEEEAKAGEVIEKDGMEEGGEAAAEEEDTDIESGNEQDIPKEA